ncbi:helix-turn-helix domain-containing protein [Paenibacillus sp. TAB 01]|uniref:helix-turn-helix domain-containing protein n=1 Tax=Paenibacillus sp. TAB 01 TaxID=3368988 RepID=UPI003750B04A
MQRLFRHSHSVFYKIFSQFLIIIFLLTSFNYYSFTFFKSNILDEIINNNKSNLRNTAKEYEDYFFALKEELLRLHTDEKVSQINGQFLTRSPRDINYLLVGDIQNQIRNVTLNRFLSLENVLIYFPSSATYIEKDGTLDGDRAFTIFYANEMYTPSFWREKLKTSFYFQVFPEAAFKAYNGDSLQLMPVVVKNQFYSYSIFALVQTNKLYDLHPSSADNLIILNEQSQPLFHRGDIGSGHLPPYQTNRSYVEENDNYYFFEKGQSGLTYVSIIPTRKIQSQITRLNLILLVLCFVSILIGIVASVILGKRFNRPIMQMVQAFEQPKSLLRFKSNIKEFDFISAKIHELNQLNRQIHNDLLTKNNQLENYEYIKKLKKIYTGASPDDEAEAPFFIILFHLHFFRRIHGDVPMDKVLYFIREYIQLTLSQHFTSTLTIQIERNQILSMVFGGNERQRIGRILHQMKAVFDHDKESWIMTVAVSSLYESSNEYHMAYEEALGRLEKRELSDQTVIIQDEVLPHKVFSGTIYFTPGQGEEFFQLLQSGSDNACMERIRRKLVQLHAMGANSGEFRQFAMDIFYKSLSVVELSKVESGGLIHIYNVEAINDLCSLDQYLQFFEPFFHDVVRAIRDKKESQDEIIAFVMDYIHNHYTDDISLEQLAAELKLSVSYLSAYIKEKTGINYLEHINTHRIGKAKELLVQTDLNVQEIGKHIGYYNANSFIRMFKKFTGTTPKEYRKQQLLHTDSAD